MVHSIELLLDEDTEAAMRRVWDDLAEAGVRSLATSTSPSNRPHVTVTVASQLDGGVDEALTPTLQRLPLTCQIGAPMVFGRGPFILVRLLVPSIPLLDLHAEVHRVCLPYMCSGPLPHARPGCWTPHLTLARRLPAGQLGTALSLRGVGRECGGRLVGLRHWDGDSRREYFIG